MNAETVEIPFILRSNQRCLTALQYMQHEYIRDFIKRFPHCFEYGPLNEDIVLFYPEGDSPKPVKL